MLLAMHVKSVGADEGKQGSAACRPAGSGGMLKSWLISGLCSLLLRIVICAFFNARARDLAAKSPLTRPVVLELPCRAVCAGIARSL